MNEAVEVCPGKITSYNAITGMAVAALEGEGQVEFKSVDYRSERPPSFPGAGVLVDVVYLHGELVWVRERIPS